VTYVKPPNPFVQLLTLIAGAAVFFVSVLIGGIVLAALVGFILLTMVIIYVRVWWLRRKLGAAARSRDGGTGESKQFVDAEYRVIDVTERDKRDR
jgi:hypothetical protein